jgi:hypothetical protein
MTNHDRIQHALRLGERRARIVMEQAAASRQTRAEAVRALAGRGAPLRVPQPPAQAAMAAAGAPARGHLVAEGDSWFDYPGADILDLLEDRHAWDVHSVAHKGDRIEEMAYMDGQLGKFKRQIDRLLRNGIVPDAILLSASGNDIAIEEFGLLLNHIDAPNPGLNHGVVSGIIDDRCQSALITILRAVTIVTDETLMKTIPIVVHGYDYPVPDGRAFGGWLKLAGPWLEPGFESKGYAHLPKRIELMQEILDLLNAMIASVAGLAEFPHVRYVDLRNTLSHDLATYKDSWANELHPTKSGFELVTDRIASALP